MTNEIKEILNILEGRKNWYLRQQKNNGAFNDEDYMAYMILDYITNLQNKYDKSLELLANFNMPCEYDEGKISHNYCEEFCDTDDETYKKCWNKYIENILRGDE